MKLKKLLALILALAMVLSSMPLALAEDLVIEEPEGGNDRGAVNNPPTIVFTVDPDDETASGSYTVKQVQVKTVGEGDDQENVYYVSEAEIAAAQEAVSKTGYHFDEWDNDVDEENAWTTDEILNTFGENKITVQAAFVIDEYDVTFEANQEVELPDAQKVEYLGKPDEIEIPELEGYDFLGFQVGEAEYDDIDEIIITGDTVITLVYGIRTFDVEFDYNGADEESIVGEPDDEDVVTVKGIEYGATIPADAYNAAPTKEGTEFAGWVPDGEYTLDGPVEGAETFTATWKDQEFEVSYEGYPNNSETIKWGEHPVGFTPDDLEGGIFQGWSLSEDGDIVAIATYEVYADTVFYPIWEMETVTVSFNLNGGEAEVEHQFDDQPVEYGSTAEDPGEPVKFGYHLKGWLADDAEGEEDFFSFDTPITADTTLTAVWEGNAYTLNIDLTGIEETAYYGGDAITGAVDEIAEYGINDEVSFELEPIMAKGHDFVGYTYQYFDAEGEEQTSDVIAFNAVLPLNDTMKLIPADEENEYALVLTPVSVRDYYVVEFDADGKVQEEIPDQEIKYAPYEEGEEVDLTAKQPVGLEEGTILDGWYLEGWYNGETKWDFDDDVTGHMTLKANWLQMMNVTFTLRDGAFVEGEDGKRAIPKGKSFAEMQELQEDLEPLAVMNFELPEAVREGYDTLTWLNGTAVFDENTVVNSNLTLKDSWAQITWTVTYDPNGGTLKDVAQEQVLNGNTVAPKTDPELAGSIFEGWFWTPEEAEEPVPFVFDEDPVTCDINLTAKWTVAKAKIGNTLYRTLDEAIAAAADGATIELLDNYELTEDIEIIPEDVSFKFGTYKVTGDGESQIFAGNNKLTIISGTFDGVVFNGDFDLKGGIFLKSAFPDCDLETFGGKYDAVTAREINKEQLFDTEKILAVVTSDGYYTCVDAYYLCFYFNREEVEGYYDLRIGKGETPAHAILEAIAREEIDEDFITNPEGIEGVDRFGGWFADEDYKTPFDLTKAYTGDPQEVFAKWIDQVTVTFVVEGEEEPFVIDSGDAVDITGWDYEEIIADANKERNPDELNEFECWEYEDHTEYKTTDEFEEDTVIFARMKAKVVFDFMDAAKEPALIQVTHGDKLVVYKDQIPEAPEDSDGWVEPTEEGVRPLNISDIINGDRTYYPLYAEKTNWDLINWYPGKGFNYDAETGDVTFIGTADEPIVMSPQYHDEEYVSDGIFVGLLIEAPSEVKETDEYQIQFDNGAWKDIKATGTVGAEVTWDGRTINNNLQIAVEQIMTLDQIKSAAKDQTPITFSVKFRKKGAEEPCAEFNVSFDPGNVKFYLDNEGTDFLIRDYRYEYTLSFDTAGGEPAEIEPITVEYGKEIELPANPTKEFYQFARWTGVNEWEEEDYDFGGGYWDPVEEKDHPEGYVIDGKYYGGWIDEEGVFHPNSIIMTDDVLLTAEWNEINAGVEINYNGHNSWDWESYVLTDPVSSVELPEVPDDGEWKFTGWDIYKGKDETTGDEIWELFEYEEGDVIGDKAVYEQNDRGDWQYVLRLRAHYECLYTMTFEAGEEPLEVNAPKLYGELGPIPVPAAEFYTDDVKAVEAEIEGFQYWTLKAPDEEGAYEEAPEKFDFEDEENLVDEDLTVYPYTVAEEEVVIAPSLNLVSEIGINFYFTLPDGAEASDYKVNVAYDSGYQTIDKDYAFTDLTLVDGEYKLKALDAGSDEMSDEVTLTVYCGEDIVATETHSIASIANVWLTDGKHDAYATLLKTMLQYGHYAEIEFDHNANETAIPAGAPALVAIPDTYATGDDPTTLADYIEYFESGLALDASVGMNIYIKPLEGYGLADFQIKVTDAAGTEIAIDDPTLVSGEIVAKLTGIYPDQLISDYKIIVTVNGVSATFTRSVMNCAYVIEQKGRFVNLVDALYQYSVAADDIFGGNG